MGTLFNQANCVANPGNTGVGDCFYTPGVIRGGFLVPKGFVLTAANLATEAALQTALMAALIDTQAKRIFPLPPFVAITDNSADPTEQTFGYGGIVIVDDGFNNWTFQYTKGGVCVTNQLRKFNKMGYRVIFIDDNGIFGMRNSTNDGIVGIPLEQFYTFPWKANTRSEVASFRVRFVFKPKFVNELVGFAYVSLFSPLELQGVQDVTIANISRPANVLNISLKVSCGGRNLVDDYGSQLIQPGVILVTNTLTGASVPITNRAVVVLNNENDIALTLNAADPAYNTTAGGMTVQLAPLSVLDPLIGDYESNKLLTLVAS